MRVVVLQHVPFEGPAAIETWFRGRGHSVSTRRLWLGDPAPAERECDVLIVMGGPMGVHDTDAYPWLESEIAAIRAQIASGTAVLGVCLGAQLVAAALGARVYRAREKEIGWWPVELNNGRAAERAWEPVLRRLPARATVMHWHGDTFDIPEGASRLGSTSICANQGFLYGDRVVGLQFHLESTEESVRRLTQECLNDIEHGHYQIHDRDRIRAMVRGARDHGGHARSILSFVLGHLEDRARQRLA